MSLLSSITTSVLTRERKSDESTTIQTNEDIALFERFMVGDDTAAILLFKKFNRSIFLYAAKLLANSEQAEDICQEVWERVIALRTKPRQLINPAGFLFTITRNLCFNQLQIRKRTVSLDTIEERHLPSAMIPGMTSTEELVMTALDALKFEDRELLVLNMYCGYKFDEIATLLELSPGAVWTRASRARAKLREIITKLSLPL
ncbi:MAG: RNA polymerase sigma factor [Ignavibacteria bacterium]|nr:RNA polymerase sigma factor [Ignavibacteria bacterium]